ncbi:MAG: HD domain-containing protein [Pseudobdellovibrionaceae bacterium]|nr:HD domain-containing protein [Bdellovibrionales bacterium]USN47998.1 MAG: HD domain-containing protein [Pseudobdellovibrionaceae bacterium]
MSSVEIPSWAKDVAHSILQAVLVKDPFTFHHCLRVGRAARKMGHIMGLPESQKTVLEYTGLFHDIGKVAISNDILLKPGRLTNEEYDVMKSHAEKSVEILRPLTNHPFFRFLIPGVRYHHEKFDGSGYPFNLKGEQIPIHARVVAVVDTVDAMMNTRPYRQALTWDHVKKELVDFSGKQFDGNLVQLYLASMPTWGHVEEEARDEAIVSHIIKKAA